MFSTSSSTRRRASSNVLRKTRAPSQNSNKPLQSHEKNEGSVGKKRPLFLLGKGNKRVPDYLLFLSRRRMRAYQSTLNFQQEKPCTSSRQELRAAPIFETEESSTSKIRQTGPLQDIEKKESSVYPLLGKKRPPFSLGEEILTIPFTSSTDGREHTLKKKGWSSPQPSNKEVWSSRQPSRRKRTPPPHAPKQKESSPQVVRGKRREFLSRRELHYIKRGQSPPNYV